jgi:hypothetical protein
LKVEALKVEALKVEALKVEGWKVEVWKRRSAGRVGRAPVLRSALHG